MQHYIYLALCGRLRWLHKRALRDVPSTFWVVFVDGGGVLRKVLGLGFGVCLEEGLF